MFESPTPSYGAWRRPGLFVRRPAPRRRPREPPRRAGSAPPAAVPFDDRARHHRARDPLRRRRGDGRRPARHRGLHDRQPPHREGVRRRRLSPASPSPAPRARRSSWSGSSRSSSSTTRRSRARSSRSRARPTSSASSCGPTCPRRCRASWSCRSSPGYDERRGRGRVFSYDATGGKYEEADFQTNGSGGVHARNWIKATWREDISRDEAIDLALRALFAAADEDTATGGPDLVRGIFPTVAAISAAGFEALPDDDRRGAGRGAARRARGRSGLVSMPVLRVARADDEGPGRLRAEGIAKGREPRRVQRGRRHRDRRREPVPHALQDQRDLRPHRVRRRRASTTSSRCLRVAGVRQADLKGYQFSREDVERPRARQRVRRRRSGRCSPTR